MKVQKMVFFVYWSSFISVRLLTIKVKDMKIKSAFENSVSVQYVGSM